MNVKDLADADELETLGPGGAAVEDDLDEDRTVGAGSALHLASDPAAALMQEGNLAFRNHKYEEAIEIYSRAMQSRTANKALLHSNRCAAFCRLAQLLRQIPAAQSERSALYGLDVTSLAELALRDSDKLVQLKGDCATAYLRRGAALVLLEQYEEAQKAFLDGLAIDPTNKSLLQGLRQVRRELESGMEGAAVAEGREMMSVDPPGSDGPAGGAEGGGGGSSKRKRHSALRRMDEFDCSLCLKLFYSPVTTPCGHTFCRACLHRALDHSNRCPVCRTVLFVSARNYPINVTLSAIIERNFPEEYTERKQEADATAVFGTEVLPMFVMDVVLPGQKMALNIFEPRYRLMVRRAMEGDHRMGMVGIDSKTAAPADVACEVEICECEPLPDGRFYLAVEGRRRCHIVRSWEQDGYRVGQVEWLSDDRPPLGSAEAAQVGAHAAAAAELARGWVSRAQEAARNNRRGRLPELVRQAGDMPPVSQPEQLSFWLAAMLPMGPEERLALMRSTSTSERLNRVMSFLRADHTGTCRLQ